MKNSFTLPVDGLKRVAIKDRFVELLDIYFKSFHIKTILISISSIAEFRLFFNHICSKLLFPRLTPLLSIIRLKSISFDCFKTFIKKLVFSLIK
jgi:hypothetical protein